MSTALVIVGWVVFGVVVLLGLALDLVGLFGNWVILVALGAVWAITGFEHFGIGVMAVLLGLAVLGEVIEAAAAGFGASRFGGSRGAVVSAVLGCIVGAIVGTPWFPIVGTLAGACLGAFVGATAHEVLLMRRDAEAAAWAGFGAALGKVAGMLAKLLVGVVMLCIAALTY